MTLLIRVAIRSAAVLVATSSFAQSQALINDDKSLQPASVVTIQKQVQEVDLLFTVTDHRNRFVRDLTSSDFAITDNGELPKRLTYFQSRADLPLRIAVVLDTSYSVEQSFPFEQKTAGMFLTQILRPTSDLALIIGFNNQVQIAQPATNDTELLSQAIRSLRVGGRTAIYDAVSVASKELGRIDDVQPSRRAIVLVTDGEDNDSHLNISQAIEIAQRNASLVYVISTNELASSRVDSPGAAMKELSEATGGNLFHSEFQSDLKKAFSNMQKELRSQYAIGYTPANAVPDGSFHILSVVGPRNLRIHCRRGYFAR
jgi:Ca-activated chloride channel family protein